MMRIKVQGVKVAVKAIEKVSLNTKKAAMYSVNRVVQRTRTDTTREAAKDYFVRVGDVRKAIVVKKANMTTLTGYITATGKPLELKQFKVNPMKVQHRGRKNRRLRARVKRNSGGNMLNGAFVAVLKDHKEENIYERVGKERYILKKLFGPSIPQMIKNEDVIDRISKTAEQRLNDETNRQIERLLGGK